HHVSRQVIPPLRREPRLGVGQQCPQRSEQVTAADRLADSTATSAAEHAQPAHPRQTAAVATTLGTTAQHPAAAHQAATTGAASPLAAAPVGATIASITAAVNRLTVIAVGRLATAQA